MKNKISLPLVNIYNKKRIIYLFYRENSKLKLKRVKDFYPYYYEPYPNGKYKTIDGNLVKKIFVTTPSEVKDRRSKESYESDIRYVQRFLIDRIENIEKTNVKYFFMDIEVMHSEDEFPNPAEAKFPVSSISIYDSYTNKIKNFFLRDYSSKMKKAEILLFRNFIQFIKERKPDIIFAWYMMGFDYPFLYNRFSKMPQKYFFDRKSKYNNFALAISPIEMVRAGKENLFLPAGISLVDYLAWYKKIYRHEKAYSLDYVMEKILGKGKVHKEVNFTVLSSEVKKRNIEDVKAMAKIEEKIKLIPLYDELRRVAKVRWEDLEYNSRIIDSLLLQEAKKQNVILPSSLKDRKEVFSVKDLQTILKNTKVRLVMDSYKKYKESLSEIYKYKDYFTVFKIKKNFSINERKVSKNKENFENLKELLSKIKDKEVYELLKNEFKDEGFEGAFRKAFKTGVFKELGVYDLSGAYMYAILDLCLDITNIRSKKLKNTLPINITDRKTNEVIKTLYIEQNDKAILPTLIKKLINLKQKYKDLKNNTSVNDPHYKDVETKYNAVKSIFLSAWGVIGNKGFRLYNSDIAGAITAVVRDLILYVKEKIEKEYNYEVIYCDTDSIMLYDEGKNLTDLLNSLIQEWSKERFNKSSSIYFEFEGRFDKIYIHKRCRYFGYIRKPNGELKKEVKGMEIKRSDSSEYMAEFQAKLMDRLLEGDSREKILEFIKEEINKFKTLDIKKISFPVKKSKSLENYKSVPVFMTALKYTQEIIPFHKRVGELYYYIYVKKFGEEVSTYINKQGKEVKRKKAKNVLAFDDLHYEHIKRENIDWDKMIERNIFNKVKSIFEALDWKFNKKEVM